MMFFFHSLGLPKHARLPTNFSMKTYLCLLGTLCGNTLACKEGCGVPVTALASPDRSKPLLPKVAGDTDLLDTWGDALPDCNEKNCDISLISAFPCVIPTSCCHFISSISKFPDFSLSFFSFPVLFMDPKLNFTMLMVSPVTL